MLNIVGNGAVNVVGSFFFSQMRIANYNLYR